jgi:hypothetical protein
MFWKSRPLFILLWALATWPVSTAAGFRKEGMTLKLRKHSRNMAVELGVLGKE